MFVILQALGTFVAAMFKSRRKLEAENLFLRHQFNIALRPARPRLRLHGSDRALLVWITQIWPKWLARQITEAFPWRLFALNCLLTEPCLGADGRMGCAPNNGGSALPDSRSKPRLRRYRHAAAARHGHSWLVARRE